jgi:gluconolactonase
VLDRISLLGGGLDHPEGIAWSPNGFIVAGGEAGQIYRVTLDGQMTEIATTQGFIYGVALDADDRVYACDFARAELCRVDPEGTVTVLSAGTSARPMIVPNFAAFDDAGNLYVTDSGTWGEDEGVVYLVTPEGRTTIWAEDVPRFPNGCCLTADGDALLVVESRARRVARIPIGPDGSAGQAQTVVSLDGSQPDGIALAADGRTMVVGCYRPDRVYVVGPGGRAEVLLDDPDGVMLNQPTNVAFVGPSLETLAISSLGGWSVAVADVGLRGLPLRRPSLP